MMLGGAEKLSALIEAANQLRVALIAQEPDCVLRTETGVQEALELARKQRYTIMPIREPDRRIRSYVHVDDLGAVVGGHALLDDVALPILADQIVALESPILSLLGQFKEHEREALFVLSSEGVSGIVTMYDLNQPAAQLFGFGLAVVVEAEVTRIIGQSLGGRSNAPVDEQVEQLLTAPPAFGARELKYWRRQKEAAAQLALLDSLNFATKLKILERGDLVGRVIDRLQGPIRDRYLGQPGALVSDLRDEVKQLRNDVAHDNATGLTDCRIVFRRMVLADELARGLALGG